MSDVISIIPARSGSKTILNKNIQLLSGHPLLAYSIAVSKLSKNIDRVIVSTNSLEYADIAKYYGAEVPFIRPQKFSTDESTDKDFLVHAIKWLKENENLNPEYWVHLRPTTPLRKVSIVDDAINLIKIDKTATALRSAHKASESPLKWFVKNGPYYQGIIDNEDYNLPKEKFNQVYIPDGYVDVIKSSFILNSPEIHGNRMIGFESPKCFEVDSQEEFEFIKYQLNDEGSELLDYLNNFIR